MSRRKPMPGMLSLLDLPESPPVPVQMVAPPPAPVVQEPTPDPTPVAAPQMEAPRIVQPGYMRDGLLELPPGLARPPRLANWYCVAHVDGTYRDALAILYRTYSRYRINRIEDVSTVMEIPVLGRCWEQREHWIWDVYAPAMAALETYAAETLGLPVADIRRRHYLTMAHSEETRAIQRDCGRLGSTWSDKGAAA